MIRNGFYIASGSVIGYAHRTANKNNQDAIYIASDDETVAAVICDGCTSAVSSEVGSKLISRFAAEKAVELMKKECTIRASEIMSLLQKETLGFLRQTAENFIDKFKAVDEMFLATIIGVVSNEFSTTVFSLGDGVFSINGKATVIDQDNTPDYLAYLISPGAYAVDEAKINLNVLAEVCTRDIDRLIIASDGAKELIEKSEKTINVLGKEERIGGLDQFESAERYILNPSLLQKRLVQINTEKISVDWDARTVKRVGGALSDDTSIVMMRRAQRR